MTAIAENPAALAPHKILTRRQQEALLAIGHFRHIRKDGATWEIGGKRFAPSIVDELARRHLVREASRSLSLTLAGQLAEKRLRERQQ